MPKDFRVESRLHYSEGRPACGSGPLSRVSTTMSPKHNRALRSVIIPLISVTLSALFVLGCGVETETSTEGTTSSADGTIEAPTINGCDLSGNIKCPGVDLSNQNLQDLLLTKADFSAGDLSGANLQGSDLSGAKLTQTDLSGAISRAPTCSMRT